MYLREGEQENEEDAWSDAAGGRFVIRRPAFFDWNRSRGSGVLSAIGGGGRTASVSGAGIHLGGWISGVGWRVGRGILGASGILRTSGVLRGAGTRTDGSRS